MLRILVPMHNAAPWLERCLKSVRCQTVGNWTCHVADDKSTDDSFELACRQARADSRFQISRNPQRLYQCGTYQRLHSDPMWDGNDICLSLDADDYLPDDRVFARVLEAYDSPGTWLTWGSFVRSDGQPGFAAPLRNAADIRHVPWRTSHLRTWRLFLWRHIRTEDLRGPAGELLRTGGDVAFMCPMVEMAGDRHTRFLSSINYVYNVDNPQSNFRIRPAEQLTNERYLKAQPPYSPLPEDAAAIDPGVFPVNPAQEIVNVSSTTD